MSGMRPGSGSRPGSRSGTPLRAWSTASSSRPGSAGSLGTSDRGTVLLLRELVHAHVGKTEGGADARQSVNTLRYAIRVVGSKIGPPPSLSSTSAVSDAIVRRLAKSYRHEDATRASYLIEVLRSNDSLSNPQLLLQLLDALAESAHDDIYVALPGDAQKVYESYGDRVDSPREPKEALLDLAGSGIPRPPSSKPPQSGSNHSGRSIPSGIDTTESPVPPPAPSPELVAAVVQRENSAVPERALLRQALFVLHGIDGDLVKSDPTGNGHPSISSKIGRGRKGLLLRVCELGAILSRVREFSQSGSEQDETSSGGKGLVVGAFKAALSEELDKFFAEMAAVETQVKNDKAWSLRRLTSWVEQSSSRLLLMNKLVSISKKLKGCALTSELDRQSRRTDGEVGRTARRLYRQSCRPILRMLRKWLAEGAIEDEYDEFFIFADSSIQNSRLWSEKYKLVRERTPSMIAPEVASAALIAGKAVDFLRACCDDREWVLQRASKMTERDFEDNRDLSNLTEAITAASSEASDRVKKLMFGKFRLVEHLESLRSYLLLMRGDFVQVITDALGEDLDKPAGMILRHNLVRVLENSMRISSGENESEIDRDRLDVRLLEASKKDTGWDIFRLDYRFTEAALENFFSDRVMNRYMRIFAFLWELKRAEHYLRNLWEVQRSWNASLNSSSDQLFLQCAFLRVKMNHFILNLQYFLV
mmetsp:Transcript_5484/g.23283  ORF Transcript_5484/g.23283 Transcript_5484/m.23283 type:complete len:704 (-) Transcript_5484:923-3034(-)